MPALDYDSRVGTAHRYLTKKISIYIIEINISQTHVNLI